MSTARSRSGKRHKCVAFGCGNGPSDEHVSLHKFPLDNPALCRIWTNFVKTTRAKWAGPTTNSKLCSSHFTKECFPMRYAIMESMGHPQTKRRTVNRDAIPTIHCCKVLSTNKDSTRTDTQGEMYGSKSSTPKPRTAFIKRENARIIADYEKRRLTQMKTEKEEAENAATSQDEVHDKNANEIKRGIYGSGDTFESNSKTQNSKPASGLQFVTTESGLKIVMNCATPIDNQGQFLSNYENKQLNTSMSSLLSTSSTQPKPAVIQKCKSPIHLIPVVPVAFEKVTGDIKDNMSNYTDTPRKDNSGVNTQPTPVGLVPSGLMLPYGKSPMLIYPISTSTRKTLICRKRMLDQEEKPCTFLKAQFKKEGDQSENQFSYHQGSSVNDNDESNGNQTPGENLTGVVIKEEPPWDNVGETQSKWPSENPGMDGGNCQLVGNTPTQCVYSSEENHEVPLEMSVTSIKEEPQDSDPDDSEMESEHVTLQHHVSSHPKKDPRHQWKCVLIKEEPKD
ncbi:uncharacterized protein [Argopecten irradians]|uniref:uncharacterized protein n=1 Tax=Argopecten irradians TaxID=31199 RepID=UPI00371006A7